MKYKLYGALIGMLCIISGLEAKVSEAQSEERLGSLLSKNELAAVLFYRDGKMSRQNKDLGRKIKQVRDDFRSASKSEPYVAFILVDLDKDRNYGLDKKYSVKTLPTVMLFRNGRPFRSGQNRVAQLVGFVNRSQIINLVEDNFADYIEDILEVKREVAARRAEQARINALYWGPYWGAGYPYYWGGYGYPYYYGRGYYGPGFGISIGF